MGVHLDLFRYIGGVSVQLHALLSVLAIALTHVISPGSAMAKAGQLTFEGTTHDFGEVARGTPLTHRFKFVNAGDAPIHIQGVHAACGCTAVEVDKGRKYQPGDTGFVEVKLDTTDFAGATVKTVTVMTSERLLPDRTLTLKATIRSEIEATPPLADFGDVVSKIGAVQTLRLKGIGAFKLEAGEVTSSSELVEAAVVRDGDGFKVTVTLKPGIKPGFLKETLTVRTNSNHLRELPIPVRATIKGPLDVAPSYLEFGALAPRENVRRSLTMKALGDVRVTGTRAELNVNGKKVDDADKFIKVDMLAYEKEKKSVGVELVNAAALAGSVHGKLYLVTSDPEQKEVAVDFYAFFR